MRQSVHSAVIQIISPLLLCLFLLSEVSSAQKFQVLHNFAGGASDGSNPYPRHRSSKEVTRTI